jgi:hypothetical protein
VLSWLNEERPGYVYPEVMGYYASLCAERARAKDGAAWRQRGELVARAIVASLSPAGALGRAGIEYSFDTGIGLCGLARMDEVSGGQTNREAIARMRDFLVRNLEQRVVAVQSGQVLQDDNSWSLAFGASALKTGIALDMAARALGDETARQLAAEIVRDVVERCFRGDAFRINPKSEWVYAHAHCYAVEGLLVLSRRGLADPAPIAPAAAWLARRQNTDGSLTNWHFRSDTELSHQGDATSQALRIWTVVDRNGYREQIARAMAFLAGLQNADGGLRYSNKSQDVNSWVSMFAAQGIAWAEGHCPAEPEWLL